MDSKLRAARLASAAGESVILASGTKDGILDAVFAGENVGTLFLPHGTVVPAWKRWLGYTARPKGKVVVDAGAQNAVRSKGKSLLPIGILRVTGSFRKGDVIPLTNADGDEFARGLTNYSSEDASRICGFARHQKGMDFGTHAAV